MQQIIISQQEALIVSVFSQGLFCCYLGIWMPVQVSFKIDDVLLKVSKRSRVLTVLNWVFKPLNIYIKKLEV